jgi:hypothetical protein
MEYRIDKQGLLDRISAWDTFLKRKVHLIACGGTALTLLGVKPSTKDIDFKQLEKRFKETASFDVSEDKVNKNFEHFLKILKKEGLINEK